jgi:hypothetical protein
MMKYAILPKKKKNQVFTLQRWPAYILPAGLAYYAGIMPASIMVKWPNYARYYARLLEFYYLKVLFYSTIFPFF